MIFYRSTTLYLATMSLIHTGNATLGFLSHSTRVRISLKRFFKTSASVKAGLSTSKIVDEVDTKIQAIKDGATWYDEQVITTLAGMGDIILLVFIALKFCD